jgi:hypothetical protein
MNNKITCHPEKPKSGQQFLTIEEKRAWLAQIFRDTSGEYSDSDKFKAMLEDTDLMLISQNKLIEPRKRNKKYRK